MIRRCCAPQQLLLRRHLASRTMVLVRRVAVPLTESRRYFPSNATHTDLIEPEQKICAANKLASAATTPPAADWVLRLADDMKTALHTKVCQNSTLIYLAACRVLSNVDAVALEKLKPEIQAQIAADNWSDAADIILECRSPDGGITTTDEFMKAKLDTNIFPGLVELFSQADLYYIISGTTNFSCFKDAEAAALQSLTADARATVAAFRMRLLRVGLSRFREWREHERRKTDPYGVGDRDRSWIDYIEKLEPSDATLASHHKGFAKAAALTSHFVAVWDKIARPTSLDALIVQEAHRCRNDYVHMKAGLRIEINTRMSSIDVNLPLIDVLADQFSDSTMNDVTTLAMSGESGSGKTQSALALATRPDVLCMYMHATDIAAHAKRHGTAIAGNDTLPKETLTHKRNSMWASCLVDELVSQEGRLAHPMQAAPAVRKRLVIIVDEAGAYPELVQAMCSKSFTLHGPGQYANTTLKVHLKVDRINLVVTGTGVSAIKAQCGSSLQHFRHVVMGSDKSKRVIDALEVKLKESLRCFDSFTALAKDLAKCRVQTKLGMVKQNPRMYAFFVEAATKSPVFEHVRKDYDQRKTWLSLRMSGGKQSENCYLLPMYTHYYTELKHCLSGALARFMNVNGLCNMTYHDVRKAIFSALLFSCLKRDWRGTPNTELESSYGILVDTAVLQDIPVSAARRGNALAGDMCFGEYEYTQDKVSRVLRVVVEAKQNHRYAVSPAHTELALSMLGAEDVEWTQLGFERIVAEALCLHTLIALHAADALITLAITEFFETWSEQLPTLGLGHADEANKRNSISVRLTAAEASAKLKLIAESKCIPADEKKLLMKLLQHLRELTIVQIEQNGANSKKPIEVTADIVEKLKLTDKELHTMLGLLLNDTARDPLREMKVRRWVDALLRRGKTGQPVAVLKTTLPTPKKDYFKHVDVGGGVRRQLVQTDWLVEKLQRRVNEQLYHLFESDNTALEMQVVVVAMMYDGAPGIDTVLAYGTCSRRTGNAKEDYALLDDEMPLPQRTHFKVDKLVKIQYKKREPTTQRSKAHKGKDRKIMLGSGASVPEQAPVKTEHWVVQQYKNVKASCTPDDKFKHSDSFYCLLSRDTTAEALHPTSWSDAEIMLDRRHEQVTQCVSIC